MLYIHETHHCIGGQVESFLHTLEKDWKPLIEADGSSRLLWVWHHAHGAGPSYRIITLTQVADWKAWGETVDNYQRKGRDLHDWYESAWKHRRKVDGKVMTPVEWSPIPKGPAKSVKANHPPTVYLHDVAFPYAGKVEQYIETLGHVYFPKLQGRAMLSMELCLRVAPGAGDVHEVVLVQKVHDLDRFAGLLFKGDSGAPPKKPSLGKGEEWMEAGLKVRDQWDSRLFRTVSWSPLD